LERGISFLRFKKKKTVKGVVLALAIGGTFVAGGCGRTLPVEESSRPGQVYENTWENASSTPFGKYPQTVEYTLGKMTEAANSHMPEGDTYENNAYTRFLYKSSMFRTVMPSKLTGMMIIRKRWRSA
jgi:putative aldouronate transport system substrate-binding protein